MSSILGGVNNPAASKDRRGGSDARKGQNAENSPPRDRHVPPMRHPPWLWLYLASSVFSVIPDEISTLRGDLVLFEPLKGPGSTILFLVPVVEIVPILCLVVGIVAVFVPAARRLFIERRHPTHNEDPEILAAMQEFVDRYTSGVEVQLTASVGDHARIYPASWRRARLLVFHPLYLLWMERRGEAEVLLLHEIAHQRQGEHLILGIGSPFSWMLRLWGAVFIPLAVLPAATLVFAHNSLGTASSSLGLMASVQLIYDLTQPLSIFLFPLAAIWLAEFSADAWAAELRGKETLLGVLTVRRGRIARSWWRLPFLDHPPIWLRRTLISRRGCAGPWLVAWPATILPAIAIAVVTGVPTTLMLGYSVADEPAVITAGLAVALDSAIIALTCWLAVLLLWPVMSPRWPHIWSKRSVSGGAFHSRPRVRPLAIAPYLIASLFPLVFLVGAIATTPESPEPTGYNHAVCSDLSEDLKKAESLKADFEGLAEQYAEIGDRAGQARAIANSRDIEINIIEDARKRMRDANCPEAG